jgi:metal-sulfur cluster biosynthetic enzyme
MTEEDVRQALRAVEDPEAGMSVLDLGLVYGIALEAGRVRVQMTMTSPACPANERRGARAVRVELTAS